MPVVPDEGRQWKSTQICYRQKEEENRFDIYA
jgi:hypothetical protein